MVNGLVKLHCEANGGIIDSYTAHHLMNLEPVCFNHFYY